MRHLGLRQLRWPTFLSQGKLYAGRHGSIAYVGRGVVFSLHKIRLTQNFHFCGCSPFYQGCSAELIQGDIKACAVFRDSHLLGTSSSSKEHASAKNLPCGFCNSGFPPALPCLNLPVATKGVSAWRQSVRPCQPWNALSLALPLPRNCQIFWTAARWNSITWVKSGLIST